MMTWAAAIEATRLGVAIRQSTWMFAAMEVVHLFGLTLVLGTALVVNLRIFGLGLRQLSVADLVSETRPWNGIGLLLSIGSGVLLLVSEAVKLAGSPPFALKMVLFAAAVGYTASYTGVSFGARRRATRGGRRARRSSCSSGSAWRLRVARSRSTEPVAT